MATVLSTIPSEQQQVPELTHLSDVYTGEALDESRERFSEISTAFAEKFGSAPEVYGRSPGRVNLIGEHIDYEGYGVLPMAIIHDTVVAIRIGGSDLHISNLETVRFPDMHFKLDPMQDVDKEHHNWGNYVMCAYKGVFEYLHTKGMSIQPVGLQMMIHGNVPTEQLKAWHLSGSGVSSSSALVCSASLALLGIFGIHLTKGEVAEFTCACERFCGTQSGGMDQAISIMGELGVAKKVDFNPIRTEDVHLPEGVTFVISNSLAVSNKVAETADGKYNLRVVECRLAAIAMARALGIQSKEAVKTHTLLEIEQLLAVTTAAPGAPPAEPLEVCTEAVRRHLHPEPYTQAELEDIIGAKLEDVLDQGLLRTLTVAASRGGFQLHNRSMHVFTEAGRVRSFAQVASELRSKGGDAALLQELGRLLDASHHSCRDLYECSCPELDSLVDNCKAAGAIGSRLTGAGWGGCTVSMVREGTEEDFIATLKAGYYKKAVEAGSIKAESVKKAIFVSKPAAGGAILRLSDYCG